jgi:hypothetical protein
MNKRGVSLKVNGSRLCIAVIAWTSTSNSPCDGIGTQDSEIESLTEKDVPANMKNLYDLGVKTAARDVRAQDFPVAFAIR